MTIKQKLWAECCYTATYLSNFITDLVNPNTPYQRFYQEHPKLPQLRTFGELCVIKHTHKIISKKSNRGYKAVMVGYSAENSSDTYRVIDLDTLTVKRSRYIIWLNQIGCFDCEDIEVDDYGEFLLDTEENETDTEPTEDESDVEGEEVKTVEKDYSTKDNCQESLN